jgi:16S rRNA (uracil1498-N3)-methyltransferase
MTFISPADDRDMTDPLFYCEHLAEPGVLLSLSGDEAHHAVASRRRHPGDTLWLFDGRGGGARATVLRVTGRGRTLDLRIEERYTEPPPKQVIHLASALPKGDRQTVMLDMATQLGMDEFTPLECERGVVKPGKNNTERWRRICVEACKQSRRLHLPLIHPPATTQEVITGAAARGDAIWIAHPSNQAISLAAAVQPGNSGITTILLGPEGGFTDKEITLAIRGGARLLSLGTAILRIETAAVALVSVFAMQADHTHR